MRSALRDSLLGSDGVDVSDIDGPKLPQKAVEDHRKLVEYAGDGVEITDETIETYA